MVDSQVLTGYRPQMVNRLQFHLPWPTSLLHLKRTSLPRTYRFRDLYRSSQTTRRGSDPLQGKEIRAFENCKLILIPNAWNSILLAVGILFLFQFYFCFIFVFRFSTLSSFPRLLAPRTVDGAKWPEVFQIVILNLYIPVRFHGQT